MRQMVEKSGRMTEDEYIKAILLFLYNAEKPTYNISEIAEGVGCSKNTVRVYLNLMRDDTVEMYTSGNTKQCRLTDKGKAEGEKLQNTEEE
jgi:Mn-dependent DtxR family transcriptional regulator